MKVICDNCRAVYKIPDDKLVKPVNKATCRKCGHRMLIPRPRQGAGPEEKTLVTAVPPTPPPPPSRDAMPVGAISPVHERHTNPAGFDDEPENTLPGATPPPMPHRSNGGGGRHHSGSGSDGRLGAMPSIPASDDVPLYTATPMPPPDRSGGPSANMNARNHPPPPAPDLSYGQTPASSPQRSQQPRSGGYTPAVDPREQKTAPPQPPPEPVREPRPDPRADRDGNPRGDRDSVRPAPRVERPDATPPPRPAPTPAPRTNPSQPAIVHDPSGDMSLAAIATIGGMVGAIVLFLSLATVSGPVGWLSILVMSIGMLLAFGGGMGALLIMFTGGRGRRPASLILSMFIGFVLSAFVTGSAATLLVVKNQFVTAGPVQIATGPAVVPGTPEPSVGLATRPPEATGADAAVATTAAPPPATVESTPATTTPGTSTVASSSGGSTTSRPGGPAPEQFAPRPLTGGGTTTTTAPSPTVLPPASSGTSSARTTPPSSTATTAPVATSTPPVSSRPPPVEEDELDLSGLDLGDGDGGGSSTPALPSSVPDDVIDTILRNNLDLKKCFFNYKKSTGTLPSRVTVQFTLQPSGRVESAGVLDPDYADTDLDSCLSRTIQGIQMPPSSGQARKVKYPFVLG